MNQLTVNELKGKFDLSNLGLSDNEIKAYVSLVTGGASTARKLSSSCGVPRTKIYLILKKLKERELVYELPETPVKYAPNSPAEAFEEYLLFRKDKTSLQVISLIESKEFVSLLEEIYRKKQLTNSELHKEEVWIVQGRSKIFRKMREMLVTANNNVTIVSTEKGFLLTYKAVGKILDKLIDNGVDINIKTPINSNSNYLTKELNYVCKVQHVDLDCPFLFISVDSCKFLLANLAIDDSNTDSKDDLGMFSQNSTLYHLISTLFSKIKVKNL